MTDDHVEQATDRLVRYYGDEAVAEYDDDDRTAVSRQRLADLEIVFDAFLADNRGAGG